MCPKISVTIPHEKIHLENDILTVSPAVGFPENYTSVWKSTLLVGLGGI